MAENPKPESLTLEQAIGRVLRKLRDDKRLARVDVCAATGFAETALKNMEAGRQSMTIRSLDALAMYYGLTIEEIIIRAKKLRGDY